MWTAVGIGDGASAIHLLIDRPWPEDTLQLIGERRVGGGDELAIVLDAHRLQAVSGRPDHRGSGRGPPSKYAEGADESAENDKHPDRRLWVHSEDSRAVYRDNALVHHPLDDAHVAESGPSILSVVS